MRIIIDEWPAIKKAYIALELDNGGINRGRSVEEACQQANFILEQWGDIDLYRVETFLDTLTTDELDTLVGGEHTEAQQIANRSAEGTLTDQLLNEFFENPAST